MSDNLEKVFDFLKQIEKLKSEFIKGGFLWEA